ncbi:MAG TPA: extracellular solute-binding protein [Armatimonadota bacterium]
MKHVLAGVFVGLLLMSVLAWKIQPAPASAGKIPLVWASDDNPVRRGQIALFNKLHPECDLRLDPTPSGMEKVIVQSLAGVGPDLFDCYDGYQLAAYVKSGIAWDLTKPLHAAGIDPGRDVWPAARPIFILNGHVYGHATNVACNAILFHKEIFQRAGIPFPKGPWTWEQLLPIAKRLTVRDANGKAKQFGLMLDWDNNWPQFVFQWGGRFYTPDGTRCVLDSPQAIAGLQFLHDLIYKYHVVPTPAEEASIATQGGWGSGALTFFGGKKGAMALGGRWWLCSLRTYPDLHLGAVECPDGPARVYRGYGRATLVNSKGLHRQKALEFIKYLASQPYNDLINHQADAVGPVIKSAYTSTYLHDPEYPQEDLNAVWRDVLQRGEPDEVSPFINGQRAARIMKRQLDLVKNDQKPVAEALRDAAREVNAEIPKILAMDPTLKAQYEQVLKGRR